MKKVSKGFTLIELLVVIAIIAVLAGLILVRISNASREARNSRRSSDMSQIKAAIEQFKIRGGGCTDVVATNATAANLEGAAKAFSTAATEGGVSKYPSDYLQTEEYPTDPQSGAGGTYYYTVDVTDAATCTVTIAPDRVTPPSDQPNQTEVPDVKN